MTGTETHQFTVRVDAAMMLLAWKAWFFRRQRVLLLALASLLVVAACAMKYQSAGRLEPLSVAGLSVVGVTILLYGAGYLAGRRQALQKHRAILHGEATYTLIPATIAAASSLGSITLDWSTVAELRRYRGLLLLAFRGTSYSTLPEAQIPAPAREFLISRCRAAGATLVDIPAAGL